MQAMRTTQKLKKTGRVNLLETTQVAMRLQQRGRGAISNQTGRFEPETRHIFDDGWDTVEEDAPKLRTTLQKDSAKTIITFNKSPDIHFDRSINPYRGCEHGCIYCFARPSHAFQGMSAGLDFESKLFFKPNAPDLLRHELMRPNYSPRPIALGMNTDAYQPIEKKLQLTRKLLQVLSAHNHPVSLLTKSALILRDLDIIAPMAAKGLCRVGVSITTLDPKLCRLMEPRAASPRLRLKTVQTLSDAGIRVTVMNAPLIPGLNDMEIEDVLAASAAHGAAGAGFVTLRLPYEIKDLFHEWLAAHYPQRAAKIINHVREMHGGKDYDARWFERGRGRGPYARLLAQRFKTAVRRYGLDTPAKPLRTDLFCCPEGPNGQRLLDL